MMFKDDHEFWAGQLIARHGVSVEEVRVIENPDSSLLITRLHSRNPHQTTP